MPVNSQDDDVFEIMYDPHKELNHHETPSLCDFYWDYLFGQYTFWGLLCLRRTPYKMHRDKEHHEPKKHNTRKPQHLNWSAPQANHNGIVTIMSLLKLWGREWDAAVEGSSVSLNGNRVFANKLRAIRNGTIMNFLEPGFWSFTIVVVLAAGVALVYHRGGTLELWMFTAVSWVLLLASVALEHIHSIRMEELIRELQLATARITEAVKGITDPLERRTKIYDMKTKIQAGMLHRLDEFEKHPDPLEAAKHNRYGIVQLPRLGNSVFEMVHTALGFTMGLYLVHFLHYTWHFELWGWLVLLPLPSLILHFVIVPRYLMNKTIEVMAVVVILEDYLSPYWGYAAGTHQGSCQVTVSFKHLPKGKGKGKGERTTNLDTMPLHVDHQQQREHQQPNGAGSFI